MIASLMAAASDPTTTGVIVSLPIAGYIAYRELLERRLARMTRKQAEEDGQSSGGTFGRMSRMELIEHVQSEAIEKEQFRQWQKSTTDTMNKQTGILEKIHEGILKLVEKTGTDNG